ncbi:MAG: hypothetical protein ACFFEU_06755 [Candidatus Thorarchaeota archaeon]
MSDADVSDSTAINVTMKGQSQLVVILGNAKIIRESARKLRSLGEAVRVGRGAFLIHSQTSTEKSPLQDLPTITFKKAREIPSVSEHGGEVGDRRVYSVVSYRFRNPTATQKKRVERLVRRSSSIRLRPSVLLFPVLRSKERRKLLESDEKHVLMDSRKLSEELRGLGAEAFRWSRLRIIDHPSELHNAVARTLSHDFTSFETLARDLRNQAKGIETQPKILKKRYAILSKRYDELKFKWSRASKIWSYDATKLLTRGYNMMLSVRRVIDSSIS